MAALWISGKILERERHYFRLGLAIVALAIAVAGVAAIDLVNRAVLLTFTEVVDTMAGRAALQVNAGADSLLLGRRATQVAGPCQGWRIAVSIVTATAFTTLVGKGGPRATRLRHRRGSGYWPP